ncbi:hypothetical protein [Vibrio sp. WXL103]|uniref:hypothetical protein n=1 Tax=Vibrio sp. WXL103 TaxID=3450710 RepID=UPI003EC7F4C3
MINSNLITLAVLSLLFSGCATKYVEPSNTESTASLTMEANGEGAPLAGLHVRFWHVENAGKCEFWEIEGDRTLMHTMLIGGFPSFSLDDKPMTLAIQSGKKSNFVVTAFSGDLKCALMSEFIPEHGEKYILKFDGILQVFGDSTCSLGLTNNKSQPVDLSQSHLCYKTY